MLEGIHRRSVSNCQNTNLNLSVTINNNDHLLYQTTHIPLARSESVFIASSLSSSFHLRIALSV
jgi:hypothetical protein